MTDPALPTKRTTKAAATATKPTVKAKPKAAPKPKAAAKPRAAAKPKTATTATSAAKTKAATPKPAPKPRMTKTAVASPSADGLPNRVTPAPKLSREALGLARRIVELAEDKKAADIVLLDLTALTTLADYFVICSGGSERQLDAIADGIVSTLRDEKTKPYGREGTPASHWVLLDFGSVVVHILTPPERDYYGIEKHWSEAKTVLRVQ